MCLVDVWCNAADDLFRCSFRLLCALFTSWEKSTIWESSLPKPLARCSLRRTTVNILLWCTQWTRHAVNTIFSLFLIVFGFHLSSGVVHGAVVLITELCERNSETLERFRKVWGTHTHTDYSWSDVVCIPTCVSQCGCAVCIPDGTRSGSDHERSRHFGLFSRPRCGRNQRSLPTGRISFH